MAHYSHVFRVKGWHQIKELQVQIHNNITMKMYLISYDG